jgi:ribonuclease HI
VAARFVLRTDGGARGNPGPAGAAFVLEAPDGSVVCSGGRFLGTATNNVAEYEALLWGLRTALGRRTRPLTIYADSELVVRQLNGVYKVKNASLRPLHAEAVVLIGRIGDVRVEHVRREQNAAADALANEAMDSRTTVGDAPDPSESVGQGSLFE